MYHIALKIPNGTSYYSCNKNCTTWESGKNINDWIRGFLNSSYAYILAYNDDEPDDDRGANVHSKGAHAKGIVAYNNQNILWMIHSIPNYPEFIDEGKNEKDQKCITFVDIDKSQLIYGQSIIMLLFPYSDEQLSNIYRQLDVMNVHLYYNQTMYNKNNKNKKGTDLVSTINMSEGITHISKHEKWGKDLYEHLAAELGVTILCETWCKPPLPSTSSVKNVKNVRWDETLSYMSTNDHSKYAVSMDANRPYVFIGDMNHMESQSRRGGGGVIIKDYVMESLSFYS